MDAALASSEYQRGTSQNRALDRKAGSDEPRGEPVKVASIPLMQDRAAGGEAETKGQAKPGLSLLTQAPQIGVGQ